MKGTSLRQSCSTLRLLWAAHTQGEWRDYITHHCDLSMTLLWQHMTTHDTIWHHMTSSSISVQLASVLGSCSFNSAQMGWKLRAETIGLQVCREAFPGSRGNDLATCSTSSKCMWPITLSHLCSEYRIRACDSHDLSHCGEWSFPFNGNNCLFKQNTIVQTAYTSVIEYSTEYVIAMEWAWLWQYCLHNCNITTF